MQSFPKQKKKKRTKKKEPERPSIMHSRESGTMITDDIQHSRNITYLEGVRIGHIPDITG